MTPKGNIDEIITAYGLTVEYTSKEQFILNSNGQLAEKWSLHPEAEDWKVDTKYFYKYTDFNKVDTVFLATVSNSWVPYPYLILAYNNQQLLSDSNLAEIKFHINYDEEGRVVEFNRFKFCEEIPSWINDIKLTISWEKKPDTTSYAPSTNWPHPNQHPDEVSESFFTTTPNPATEWISISWENASSHLNLKIYNMTGGLVYNYKLPEAILYTTHKISIENLPTGLYLLTMEADNRHESKTLLIQR
jgi:hypothetical protein